MDAKIEEQDLEIFVHLGEGKIYDELRIHETGEVLKNACVLAAEVEKPVTVDMEHIEFVSSAMIGKLIIASKFAEKNNVRMRYINIAPQIQTVFSLSKMDKVLGLDLDI